MLLSHIVKPLSVALTLKPSSQRPPLTCYRHLIIFCLFFAPIHPSCSRCPSAGSGRPGLQASQHALTTGSFNAAAISSRLMSSAGGAGPSSLEQ